MKNEILKYQLDNINRVLLAFRDRGSISCLSDDFDLFEISKINCHLLVSQYLEVAFKISDGGVDELYIVNNEMLKDVYSGYSYIVPGVNTEHFMNRNITSLKDADVGIKNILSWVYYKIIG
jgi:hypothetical protein